MVFYFCTRNLFYWYKTNDGFQAKFRDQRTNWSDPVSIVNLWQYQGHFKLKFFLKPFCWKLDWMIGTRRSRICARMYVNLLPFRWNFSNCHVSLFNDSSSLFNSEIIWELSDFPSRSSFNFSATFSNNSICWFLSIWICNLSYENCTKNLYQGCYQNVSKCDENVLKCIPLCQCPGNECSLYPMMSRSRLPFFEILDRSTRKTSFEFRFLIFLLNQGSKDMLYCMFRVVLMQIVHLYLRRRLNDPRNPIQKIFCAS